MAVYRVGFLLIQAQYRGLASVTWQMLCPSGTIILSGAGGGHISPTKDQKREKKKEKKRKRRKKERSVEL